MTERSSADVLTLWRQALATRMLGLQLVLALPLLLWGLPQMVASHAWVMLVNVLLQLVLQVAVSVWRSGPLVLRGGLTSVAFVASGAGVTLGGGDPAVGALFLLTGLVMSVVLLGVRSALVVLAVDAAVLALHVWANGMLISKSLIVLDPLSQRVGLLAVCVTLGGIVVASIGFLLERLREAITDAARINTALTRESAEKQSALEVLRVTQERVLEAGKMELLGQLAGGIAHDMNNALTIVLAEAGDLREQNAEASENITDAVAHATKLTQQLLAMGRRDTVQPRPLDVSVTIENTVRLVRRTLPSDITVETSFEPDMVIRADPNQVHQLVLNLATNARDAMLGGGTLSVTVRGSTSAAIIEVRDTGQGIDEATQQRMFEPFFTTKPAGRGTGLGLASVQDIVSRLGGSIACESAVGKGTRFTVTLPRVVGHVMPAATPTSTTPRSGLQNRRILVAEDDIRIRAVVVGALTSAGATVIDADSAHHAITLAEKERAPFDLVWTDVVMPNGGAAPLLEWVSVHAPTTPVIVCSGYADDELIRRDVATGRYRLLSKPFSPAQAVSACIDTLSPTAGP